jgi:dolichol-phosphate mannosyltransferase
MNQNNHHQAALTHELIEAAASRPTDKAHQENIVIIPTYNEAINLKLLVPSILHQGPFDVLIVDDHSPDGTGEVAEALARHFAGRVAVLHRAGKLGLATAYLQGFHYALARGYQRIFTMDADFSHDPGRLPTLRAALEETDVVLGSRYVPGGGTLRWPLWRRLLSRGGSAYARLLLRLPIRDLTGGFKGFRRPVLEALLPELDSMHSKGYAFQIEVTYRCSRHGFRIQEVPILFEDRVAGQSKLNWRILLEALRVVWALRLAQGPARSRLARQRLTVATLAVVVLAILLGTVSLASPRFAHPVQRGAAHQAASSQLRQAASIRTRSLPAPPATRPQHPVAVALLQLQGADLTPNVPLRFTGSGFLPWEALGVIIQDQAGQPEARLESIIADRAGHFSAATEAIPVGLAPGTHTLLVQGESSHRTAQASFQLHWIPPAVVLDAYTVKPGQDFGFAGSGFLPNETVAVRLGSPAGQPIAAVRANARGNVTGHVTIPLMPAGNYVLYFVGQESQTPTSVGLNIQGFHPWVTLDTYAPSPQTRLGFLGEDFAPGEEVRVYLNRQGGKPVVRLHADASGRFAVPAAWDVGKLSGEHLLFFVGQHSGAVVTTTFTVVP